MKKYIFLIFSLFVLFTSCKNNDEYNKKTELETNTMVVTDLSVTTSISESLNILETTITKNTIEEIGIIEKAMNQVRIISVQGLLFDFNFDTVPELMLYSDTASWYCFSIYQYIDEKWSPASVKKIEEDVFCYQILASGNNYENEPPYYIDLYYDKERDEYFYISMYNLYVTNIDLDDPYIFSGMLYKYYFEDMEILEEELFNFRCSRDDEEGKESFFLQCDEILLPYEKIKTIPLDPMWTYEDIQSGAYQDIIRQYFEENPVN